MQHRTPAPQDYRHSFPRYGIFRIFACLFQY
ncbi:hypothetical protein T03_901 [Trichinella britovi]|uniref:Uncharacterized protein n=1 Tax=Trichinella britovi TaxID=45882 RepID=A0A0V0YZD5_TRIBR|nr:hypothetical protein T03_901 [Trichinella britovi]